MHANRRMNSEHILVPIAYGELLDKLSILGIKRVRSREKNTDAFQHIETEWRELSAVRAQQAAERETEEVKRLYQELCQVNAHLWDLEDRVRALIVQKDYGECFVFTAENIPRANDRRCKIKRRINEITGSRIVEEKIYALEHGEEK